MKKIILFYIVSLTLNVCINAKPKIAYSLVLLEPLIDTVIVYPKATYTYLIDRKNIGAPFQGSTFTSFKITVQNGSFDDGTNVKQGLIFGDYVKVKWNDALKTQAKINIEVQTYDTVSYSLVKGRTKIHKQIASLKGEVPVFTAGPFPAMGTKNNVIATIHQDMYFPEIRDTIFNVIIFQKKVTDYEWTLPNGWTASGYSGQIFTTGNNVKTISITPNLLDTGTVKVRALNVLKSTGSEYGKQIFDRDFAFTSYPSSITFGDNTARAFAVSSVAGVTYEWNVPDGWKINGGSSMAEGYEMNSVSVTPAFCSTNSQVRVRLKKDNEISPWHICPYLGIPAPSFTVSQSTIYQHEETTVSLGNINTTDIQSIVFFGDGVYHNSTQGSDYKISFNKTGTIILNVSVQMKNCSAPVTFQKTFTVAPHRISISGSTHTCPSSTVTFTVNNAPANYTWGCSSNLTPVSGNSGSFTTSSVGGSAWVSIRINGAEITRKNFTIGSEIDGVEGIYSVLTTQYTPEPFCPGQVKMWTLDWQGRLITEKPDTVYGHSVFGMNYVDVKSTSAPGVMTIYDLSLIQENGVTATKWISVRDVKLRLVGSDKPKPIDPFPPIDFLLSPNPATSSVTICLQENEDTEDVQSHSALNRNTLTASYTIQLWNSYSLVKSVQTDLKEYQMDLHGVPTGFYYVLVIKDGQTYRKQLMVK